MKAAVLHAVGEPMRLEETRLAEPRAGEVLVRIQAVGVCHSDLHYLTGDLTCLLPVVLGHEGAGIVEQTGPEVRGLEPGDAVILMWRPRCGQCEFCLAGRPALCVAIKVPVATVGLSVLLGAALAGASPIIVADVGDSRLDLAKSLGASHTVNTAGRDLEPAVREVLPGGVQWAFEAVGKPETLLAGVRSLRPTGTLVAIGLSRAGQTVSLPINELVQKDIRVVGSLYGSSNTVLQIPRLLELYQAGRLPLDRLLGSEYRLEDINEAYARLPMDSVGRGLILIGETE
jgi:Zn-dependent alcohol dehydrogenase